MIFSHLLATSTSTSTRCDVTKMEEVVSLYNEAEEHFKDQVIIWKGRTFWNSPNPVANMMHMTCGINPNNENTNTKQIQIHIYNISRWRSGATMPGSTTTQAGGSAWTSTLWVWSGTDWHWSTECRDIGHWHCKFFTLIWHGPQVKQVQTNLKDWQMWQMAVMMGTYYAMDRMSKMKGEKKNGKWKQIIYWTQATFEQQMALESM